MLRHHVLIIDDNPSDLLLASTFIENGGYVSIKTANAHDGLAALDQYAVSAAVIDIQMKGVSGYELVKAIRRTQKLASIPIMMMSARSEAKDVKMALELGANDYVLKPIDPLLFVNKVKKLIHNEATWAETIIDPKVINPQIKMGLSSELLSFSEMGLKLKSPVEVPIGTMVDINIAYFASEGIEPLNLRLVHQEKGDGFYICDFTFVGVKEKDLKKIRMLSRKVWNQGS